MDRKNPRLKRDNASILPNIRCKRCHKALAPEVLLILLKKELVHCPNCWKRIRRKFVCFVVH